MFTSFENNPQLVSAGFSVEACRLMALASKIAYEKGSEANRLCVFHGADAFDFVDDSRTDTQLFIAARGLDVVVSFRGTEDVRDAITDLQLRKVIWHGQLVHHGFAAAFAAIEERLHAILLNHFVTRSGDIRIWFTGHSLGGALTSLAVVAAREWGLPVHGVYSFGSPRVGSSEFAIHYDCKDLGLHDKTFRVVHEEDIVPRIISKAAGYTHVGQEIFLNAFGGVEVDPPLFGKVLSDGYGIWRAFLAKSCGKDALLDFLQDHYINSYIERLNVNR